MLPVAFYFFGTRLGFEDFTQQLFFFVLECLQNAFSFSTAQLIRVHLLLLLLLLLLVLLLVLAIFRILLLLLLVLILLIAVLVLLAVLLAVLVLLLVVLVLVLLVLLVLVLLLLLLLLFQLPLYELVIVLCVFIRRIAQEGLFIIVERSLEMFAGILATGSWSTWHLRLARHTLWRCGTRAVHIVAGIVSSAGYGRGIRGHVNGRVKNVFRIHVRCVLIEGCAKIVEQASMDITRFGHLSIGAKTGPVGSRGSFVVAVFVLLVATPAVFSSIVNIAGRRKEGHK